MPMAQAENNMVARFRMSPDQVVDMLGH